MSKTRILRIFSVFSGFVGLIIYCAGGTAVSYNFHGNIPEHCRSCYISTGLIKCSPSTQCIIYYGNGKREFYCCPHCAFPERMKLIRLGERIWKTTVLDFETGKTINAVGACYLVGSKLNLCCSPSVIAFRTRLQAEQFQHWYGGTITRLSQ